MSIIELQSRLVGAESVDGFLTEMAALAVAEIGQALSCGITLRADGLPATVVSTDSLAARVDETRYGLEHGPCQSAMRTRARVVIADSAADRRWTDYGSRAVACGVRSSLALPLEAEGLPPRPPACGKAERGESPPVRVARARSALAP